MSTITRGEYLQLLGLFTLAREHNRQLESIRRAAAPIVGEDPADTGSCTADQVYSSDPDVDALLRRLGVTTVAEETPA